MSEFVVWKYLLQLSGWERYRSPTNVMKSITIHDSIVDVANIFLQTKYKGLLVMDDDGKLVGQISRRDILRANKNLNTTTW